MNKSCPACGSENIESKTNHKSIPVIYGDNAEFDEVIDHCQDCGEEGDFVGANDEAIQHALTVARKHSVCQIVDYLQTHDIKAAYFERSLELPARTINRWKTGDVSAAGIALLRVIRTYPWILEVADENYDVAISQNKLAEQASKLLKTTMDSHNIKAELSNVTHNMVSLTLSTTNDYKVASLKQTQIESSI